MAKEYQLKRPVLDQNRLQKYAKKILDESSEDRQLALDAYRYFKNMVDENPQDSVAKQQMTDCLKLAQSSKGSALKVMDLLIKFESNTKKTEGSSSVSLFHKIEELASNE
jgi:LPS O-antigen subunit length determinant protein (WzzB/FepE family)|tara:strand:- start:1997 stop:2326 length:330 start_codon:yes stop_codon:yes gene_type:complete